MHRRKLACWLLVGILLFPYASVAEPAIEAFAKMPTFTDVKTSPGGEYVATRQFLGSRYVVSLFRFVDGRLEYFYGFGENATYSVAWFEWVSPNRLLVSVAFTATRAGRSRVQTQERRLFSLDAETTEMVGLFRTQTDETPIQIQDRVVSFLPDDPKHILVQYYSRGNQNPGIYRVNVTKMTGHKRITGNRKGVDWWMADSKGDVRLGEGVRSSGDKRLIIRRKDSKDWSDFSDRVNVPGETFDVVGFSDEPDTVYVRSNHEGDPLGLYSFNIDTDTFGPLIYKHEFVDVSSVDIDEDTGDLMSVNFVDDDVRTIILAERPISDNIRDLNDQYPSVDISVNSVSSDGNYAVLLLYEEGAAGTFYIYDSIENRLSAMPPQYPDLAQVALGKTFSTEYAARDELVIPTFITLPAEYQSLDDAKDLPFIIHPHGGPGARDFMRFSFDVQYFVSRGYGVLQMNFRGSTGYGQAFKEAGDREWGQAMQDDITDGVAWLLESNYADADRIAIVGGSYGGYAALMGVVKTPDLYQCAVSFAGVTDLPELIRDQRKFIGGRNATRFIGERWSDRKMLAHNSPARRAEEITVPVLLIHGEEDTVVEIDQSEKMAKQLKKHGKEHKFVVLETGDHHHSLYENRLTYLREMDQFLNTCLQ